MMDLIFKLKCRYPTHVVFIIGNHDSFSPDVMKGGGPPGPAVGAARHRNVR